MSDKEIKYNKEGYKDDTAYKAIKNVDAADIPRAGEVWFQEMDSGHTFYCIIVATNGNVSTILRLTYKQREEHDVCVNVGGEKMYTNSCMLQYGVVTSMKRLERVLTDDEWSTVINRVAESLNLECKTGKTLGSTEVCNNVVIGDCKSSNYTNHNFVSQSEEVCKIKAQLEVYKELYRELLYKVGI